MTKLFTRGAKTTSDARGLQAELLSRGLSVKYVKNIMSGSFRAMIQQAKVDELVTRDIFAGLRWPRWRPPEPDPFTPDERGRILEWFRTRTYGLPGRGVQRRPHQPFFVYVHLLFWSGMRPSEASGLQVGDLDLKWNRLHVQRSRHLYDDGAPKTLSADRWVELFPETVRLLRDLQPLHLTPETPVFATMRGQPIEPKTFSDHWYDCLRALGIRVRGLYCTKGTFVTTALQKGVKIAWLETQTGVNYATLRRHYGKWMPTEGESELRHFAGVDPTLFKGPECVRSTKGTDTFSQKRRDFSDLEMRGGGLEPPGNPSDFQVFREVVMTLHDGP